MPAPVWRKAFGGQADLRREAQLELVVGHLEKGEELAREDAHVALVDEGIRELEGAPANANVAVAQAVENDVAVTLHGVGVHRDDLVERVERNVANVVVAVAQKLAQNVDGHDAQPVLRLDLQHRENRLVQNRVAHVLARFRVGGYLG